jgi:hypothetical protein
VSQESPGQNESELRGKRSAVTGLWRMCTLACGGARAYRYANVHNRRVDGVDESIVLMALVSVALIAVEHFQRKGPSRFVC